MIDLHCHLLPGLDDGAADLKDSVAMAEALVDLGYRQIFGTPHLPWGQSLLTREEIGAAAAAVGQALLARGRDLLLSFAAEHAIGVLPELLQQDRGIAYPGARTLLVEFPLSGFPARWEECLFRAQVKGITPVIAHVERYSEVQKSLEVVRRFREKGYFVLANLSSFSRRGWSKKACFTAEALVKEGLLDAVNTDLHSVDEAAIVAEGLDALTGLVDARTLDELTRGNPERISRGEQPER